MLGTSNSLAHYAKGTLSSRQVGTPTDCRHTVSGTFNSPPGVLFTFPSRYYCTIGHEGVFSLMPWSALIPARFHVSRGTRECNLWSLHDFAYGTVTLFGAPFQTSSTIIQICNSTQSLQPPDDHIPLPPAHNACRLLHATGFRLIPVRSPLLRESLRFLFLQVLRCFTSLGSPPDLSG